MTLIDTSAWVEFLRGTGSATALAVRDLISRDAATICDPVRMELLAGARDEAHLTQLRRLTSRATVVPTLTSDYEEAAALYRACRRNGETVRKLIDCLIGAIAIRSGLAVLHADADFDALARHTALEVHGSG